MNLKETQKILVSNSREQRQSQGHSLIASDNYQDYGSVESETRRKSSQFNGENVSVEI